MIQPRLDPSLTPPFCDLDEYKFQRLCRDLFLKEERIRLCRVFGTRGQKQYGIDLWAQHAGKNQRETGQCKKYSKISAAEIERASDEFFQHLKVWKERSVARFILFVACDLEDPKLQEQELKEQKRFSAVGIGYEIWSGETIWNKLRKHPELVQTYCGEHYVKIACGPTQATSQGAQQGDMAIKAGTEALTRLLGSIIPELGEARNKDLEAIRELSAEGHGKEALKKIQIFRTQPGWGVLPEEVRAKALRMHASLALSVIDDLAQAKSLLDEAKEISPADNTRPLESLVVHRERGALAALKVLDSPHTVEEWNIYLRLLLELGRPQDVLSGLDDPPNAIKPNVDTQWPKSIALLLSRRVDEARNEIRDGLRQKPRDFSLRYAAAMIDYASTVSSSFSAWGHLTWPVPPAWDFVKRDAESVRRLQVAADEFDQLSHLTWGDERIELLIWKMASLANQAERQQEAFAIFEQIIEQVPGCSAAILWAHQRAWPLNLESTIKALESRIQMRHPKLDDIVALFALLIENGLFDRAEAIISQHKPVFEAEGKAHLWLLDKAQVLCARDAFDEASALVEKESDPQRQLEIHCSISKAAAWRTGGYAKAAQQLEALFKQTKDADVLLDCCRFKARAKDWEFIADHATELVRLVNTEGALRLAVQGAFESHRPQLCLDLLEQNKHFLLNEELSADLRRLKMECYRRLGRLSAAIAEAERLLQQKQEFQHAADLFLVQRQKGDLSACAITARKFLEISDVPAAFLLNIIPTIRSEDPQLAKELWELARKRAASANTLAQAGFLAFVLGIDQKANDLVAQFPDFAAESQGSLRAMSVEEAVQLFREARQQQTKLADQYERGNLPIHPIASQLRSSLGRLYCEAFIENQKTDRPSLRPPIFACNGNRAAGPPVTIESRVGIFMDLTSLLLADMLGIIDDIDSTFSKIYISGHLPTALLAEIETLTPVQPTMRAARDEVLALLAEKKLLICDPPASTAQHHEEIQTKMGREWCELIDLAKKTGGVLVDFSPLHSNSLPLQPVQLPEEYASLVCGLRDVAHAMENTGLISATEATSASNELGGEKHERQVDLSAGRQLIFEHGVASQFARVGLLTRLANRCNILLTAEEAHELKREQESAINAKSTCERIGRLVNHISRGIDSGKYQMHLHPDPKAAVEDRTLHAYELLLYDAIHFGQNGTAVIWCDDRFLNGHQTFGQSRVVSICDVLNHLRVATTINDDQYFDLLQQLRSANVRYVPVSEEELLYHLRRSPVQANSVEESPGLSVLRRYIAACMLDRDRLQKPLSDEQGNWNAREMAFPLRLNRTVIDAFFRLWEQTNEPVDQFAVRINWMWKNIYADVAAFRQSLVQADTSRDARALIGMSVGHLLAQGLQLSTKPDQRRAGLSARQQFFEWIEDNVIAPRMLNSSNLIQDTVKVVAHTVEIGKSDLVEAQHKYGNNSPQAVAQQHVIGCWICDLPPVIRDNFHLSSEELKQWGLTETPTVNFLSTSFNADEFWDGVARAMKSGGATIRSADGGKLRFQRGRDALTLPAVFRKGHAKHSAQLQCTVLPLLASNQKVRIAFLQSHLEWFDLSRKKREEEILRISEIRGPRVRLWALDEIRRNSAAWLYTRLQEGVRRRERISIADLLLTQALHYENHLRLVTCSKTSEPDCDTAVTQLLEDEGLEETIVRCSCIPSPLPAQVSESLQSLTKEEQLVLIAKLEKELVTPVQRIHLVALLNQLRSVIGDVADRLRKQVEYLTTPETGGKSVEAFLAMLQWLNLRLGWNETTAHWHPSVRLRVIWTHASQLYAAFLRAGASAKKVHEWFQSMAPELGRDHVAPELTYVGDVAHPTNVNYTSLILHGITACTGSAPDDLISQSGIGEILQKFVTNCAQSRKESYTFCRKTALCPNTLKSFLGDSNKLALRRLLGTETHEKKCFVSDPDQQIELALAALNKNPHDPLAWVSLQLVVEEAALTPEIAEALSKILQRIDFGSAFTANAVEASLLVLLVPRFASALGIASISNRLQEQVYQVAATASKTRSEKREPLAQDQSFLRLAGGLMEATAQLSRISSDPTTNVSELCDRYIVLLRCWPELATQISDQLPSMLQMLPFDCQVKIWPLIFTLRSLT
jgi:tetratricopeptide (TPR) repeat protein